MLLELKVSNFALIEDLSFNFSSGLNVLSGETGAGKSIVIGAVSLLLGERANVEYIRQGEESAYVEAMINCSEQIRSLIDNMLEEAGIAKNEELIIARELHQNGRSVARVNGRAVPVTFLKELGQILVDLHGQHQHQSLLRSEQHLDLLDSFGGEKISACRKQLGELFNKRQRLSNELSELGNDSTERERRLDVYAFQLREIREANLETGEDEELAKREKILANAEKLWAITAQAYTEIYAGEEDSITEAIIDRLNKTQNSLSEAAGLDESFLTLVDMLESASAQLEEVSHELRNYQSKLEFDPGELSAIQDRLNHINNLKRKYGGTIEEILTFADQVETEMERLKNSEAMAEQLEQEISELENEMKEESAKLRELRRETAKSLESLLQNSLQDLAMPNAQFFVDIKEKEKLSPKGMDQVEFLFSANQGEEVKPLTKIISGGEVSRVMLALKTIFAQQDLVPTLVFDEVDSGVGGSTIQAVAEKLAQLARHHQVMCVTHSPQIGAMADCHYSLYKETVGERTLTRAAKLTEEEKRREELARMLDGASIDQVSLKHVDSVLERARRFKEKLVG
ncbi:MAG: DNA repair protein RecN [Bacillota bacterium]